VKNSRHHQVKTIAGPKIGVFAVLSGPFASRGTGAPSHPRFALTSLCAAALALLALALAAAPASAAVPPNFCPEGSLAGQCSGPRGVAVDQSSGDIYVADIAANRVAVFDEEEHFIRAFGFGASNGAEELQVCTTSCQAGKSGSAPGEIVPASVAVDNDPASLSFHDLYVTDPNNSRVEKFTPAGAFILAFGSPGTGPGQLSNERPPVAVDATGNVWVGDVNRLEKFGEAGEFLSEVAVPGAGAISGLAIDTDPSSPSFEDLYALNSPVNEDQEITPPSSGTYTLSFEGETTKAIPSECDPAQCLQELPAIGAGNVIPAGAQGVEFRGRLEGRNVPQLEISAGGSVTTLRQGIAAVVSKLNSAGTLLETIDESGHPQALGLDSASGDIYVSDQIQSGAGGHGPASLLRYDSSGTQTESFGTGGVLGGPLGNALAFGDGAQRLYVASRLFATGVQAFPIPEEGPLPEENSEKAEPIGKTSATLHAALNPEGHATTAHFQYITEQKFKEDGNSFGAGTETTSESAPVGEDFSQHPVPPAPITGLQPETTYRFRLVATNECRPSEQCTVNGEGATFTTEPPVRIDATYVLGVSATSATLRAEVNPLGDPAEYRFEYLTEAEYQENGESFSGPNSPSLAPVPDGQIAATEEELTLSRQIAGLQPVTAYRYRIFLHNAIAPAGIAGPVGAFTTQSPVAPPLPDARQWEQVTPPSKFGSRVRPMTFGGGLIEAAAGGGAFSSVANGPLGPQAQGSLSPLDSQWLSVRAAAGWSTRDITTPHESPCEVGPQDTAAEYYAFSEDLSSSIVRPRCETPLSPFTSTPTPYRREPGGEFVPLIVGCPAEPEPCSQPIAEHANVPAGAEFGPPDFVATPATPDLSHVVLESKNLLTGDFKPGFKASNSSNVYELSGSELTLISVLPNGEPVSEASLVEAGLVSQVGTGNRGKNSVGSLSADGERVVFSTNKANETHLYLRINATQPPSALDAEGHCTEAAKACTIQLDAPQGGTGGATGDVYFAGANRDASKLFFLDGARLTPDSKAAPPATDLYMCDITADAEGHLSCTLTDLSVTVNPGEPASVAGAGSNVSAIDASGEHVYFAAGGVLTDTPNSRGEVAQPALCNTGSNASLGAADCNLYVYNTITHAVSLIGVLSALDSPDWGGGDGYIDLTARSSPGGRYFTFMSRRPLTGYDNRDAKSGQRDEEVFLYGSASEALRCVSCNPTGARPHGVLDPVSGPPLPLVDETKTWHSISSSNTNPEFQRWLAASIPGWTGTADQYATYQSRYLSDSGRLFFNSADALVPADTNGVMDVYEYEPPGVGDCTENSSTYSTASGGCVGLISSGISREESAFLDASESGNDVFFLTAAQLSKRDTDTAYDVYDARVGGGEPEPVKPIECVGDACQSLVAAPNDPTPGSLTFQGPGNLIAPLVGGPEPNSKRTATQVRAEKLLKALKACKKDKKKAKRSSCEKTAHKKYGATAKAKRAAHNLRRTSR
jgi:hypothetical protein